MCNGAKRFSMSVKLQYVGSTYGLRIKTIELIFSHSWTIQFPSDLIVPNRLWRLGLVYNKAIANRNGKLSRTLLYILKALY
jgi:hypothetical protein